MVVCWYKVIHNPKIKDFMIKKCFLPWKWKKHISPKYLWICSQIKDITSQKPVWFIVTKNVFSFIDSLQIWPICNPSNKKSYLSTRKWNARLIHNLTLIAWPSLVRLSTYKASFFMQDLRIVSNKNTLYHNYAMRSWNSSLNKPFGTYSQSHNEDCFRNNNIC
jgi:hypothetical protein